jgi:hypothetical protein
MKLLLLPLSLSLCLSLPPLRAGVIETDLLIVGADESGCAAAMQAARLGVKRIVLTNDHDWLGGQFSTQGIGPIDEWTVVEGKRVNFPRSGAFLEIIDRIRAHNRRIYGVATPGNGWCGTDTIEPRAAAERIQECLKAGDPPRPLTNIEMHAAVFWSQEQIQSRIDRDGCCGGPMDQWGRCPETGRPCALVKQARRIERSVFGGERWEPN